MPPWIIHLITERYTYLGALIQIAGTRMKGQYEDITANFRGKKHKYDRMLTLYLHSGEVIHFENKEGSFSYFRYGGINEHLKFVMESWPCYSLS